MNEQLIKAIKINLEETFGVKVKILETSTLNGGTINSAGRIITDKGNFFVKWNDTSLYKGMFESECKGLKLLKAAGEIKIPDVMFTGNTQDFGFLVLENIESGTPQFDFWDIFGNQLAKLHQHKGEYFGLEYDNFIGSLPQINTPTNNWVDFFINNRLEPQLKLAIDSGKADLSIQTKFESLYKNLNDIFPKEKPSLLHGDLWSGNFMTTITGDPAIFDPSVYYGHREMDLAMSRLFGGFDFEFYDSYNEVYPLEKNWQKRIEICNLYPLLVHVNLFVGSYIQSVRNIVSKF
jgi:fructosamine-3-kinase